MPKSLQTPDKPARTRFGRFLVVRIGGEWHVLFEPDDLPHHFLSVARFQNHDRAKVYADLEEMVVDDDGGQHADMLGLAEIVDPRPATPSEWGGFEPPVSKEPAEGLAPETSAVRDLAYDSASKGITLEAGASRPVAQAAEAVETPPTLVVLTAAENRDKVLNHYAKHGGTIAQIQAATGVGSTSLFMAAARKDGDPRIAAGDAKREPIPAAAARNIARSQLAAAPRPLPSVIQAERPAQPAPAAPSIAPLPDGRKRTAAEMIEAARQAVPAPSFGDRRGVSCKTG